MNKAMIVGRITHNPELRYTPQGVAVCSFDIAVNNYKNEADYIPVVAWKHHAEAVAKYCKKGGQVGVTGKIKTRIVEKDGKKRKIVEVIAEDIDLVGAKSNDPLEDEFPPSEI